MFNKEKCKKCKYHSIMSGSIMPICNYGYYHMKPCLRRGEKGTIIDIRGDDPDNCKAFVEGRHY